MSAQEEYEKIKAKIEQQVKYGLPETPSVTPSAQPYTEVQPTVQEEYQAIDYSGNLVNISPEGLTKRTVTYGEYTGNVSRENWWKTKGGYPEGISFNVWTDKNGNEYIEGFDGKLVTSDAFNRFNSVGWAFLPEGLTGKKGGSSLYEVVERRSKNTPGVGPAPISQMAVLIGAEGAAEYAEQNKEGVEAGTIDLKTTPEIFSITTPDGNITNVPVGESSVNIGGTVYQIDYSSPNAPVIQGAPSGTTLSHLVAVGPTDKQDYVHKYQIDKLDVADQEILKTKGVAAFNQEIQQRQASYEQSQADYEAQVNEFIQKSGGNIEYYNSLATPEAKEAYIKDFGWKPVLTEAGTQVGWQYDISRGETAEKYAQWKSGQITEQQWMDYIEGVTTKASGIAIPPSPVEIERFITSYGGSVSEYNSLVDTQGNPDIDARNNYLDRVSNDFFTTQTRIVNSKIQPDAEGNYPIYNLTNQDLQDTNLVSALTAMFGREAVDSVREYADAKETLRPYASYDESGNLTGYDYTKISKEQVTPAVVSAVALMTPDYDTATLGATYVDVDELNEGIRQAVDLHNTIAGGSPLDVGLFLVPSGVPTDLSMQRTVLAQYSDVIPTTQTYVIARKALPLSDYILREASFKPSLVEPMPFQKMYYPTITATEYSRAIEGVGYSADWLAAKGAVVKPTVSETVRMLAGVDPDMTKELAGIDKAKLFGYGFVNTLAIEAAIALPFVASPLATTGLGLVSMAPTAMNWSRMSTGERRTALIVDGLFSVLIFGGPILRAASYIPRELRAWFGNIGSATLLNKVTTLNTALKTVEGVSDVVVLKNIKTAATDLKNLLVAAKDNGVQGLDRLIEQVEMIRKNPQVFRGIGDMNLTPELENILKNAEKALAQIERGTYKPVLMATEGRGVEVASRQAVYETKVPETTKWDNIVKSYTLRTEEEASRISAANRERIGLDITESLAQTSEQPIITSKVAEMARFRVWLREEDATRIVNNINQAIEKSAQQSSKYWTENRTQTIYQDLVDQYATMEKAQQPAREALMQEARIIAAREATEATEAAVALQIESINTKLSQISNILADADTLSPNATTFLLINSGLGAMALTVAPSKVLNIVRQSSLDLRTQFINSVGLTDKTVLGQVINDYDESEAKINQIQDLSETATINQVSITQEDLSEIIAVPKSETIEYRTIEEIIAQPTGEQIIGVPTGEITTPLIVSPTESPIPLIKAQEWEAPSVIEIQKIPEEIRQDIEEWGVPSTEEISIKYRFNEIGVPDVSEISFKELTNLNRVVEKVKRDWVTFDTATYMRMMLLMMAENAASQEPVSVEDLPFEQRKYAEEALKRKLSEKGRSVINIPFILPLMLLTNADVVLNGIKTLPQNLKMSLLETLPDSPETEIIKEGVETELSPQLIEQIEEAAQDIWEKQLEIIVKGDVITSPSQLEIEIEEIIRKVEETGLPMPDTLETEIRRLLEPARISETEIVTIPQITPDIQPMATPALAPEMTPMSVPSTGIEGLTKTLTETMVEVLSRTQPSVQALTQSQVQALTEQQIQNLTQSQIQSLTESQIQSLTNTQIQSLTQQQIQALTQTQIQALTQTQIQALTETQIQALTQTQIETLTETQIEALTDTQIEAMTDVQIKVLTETKPDIFDRPSTFDRPPTKIPPRRIIKPPIIGSGGKPLTKEQLAGAIGWKQGIMYKYIYPPYGQEDIINSRSPIQGIPMKEGIRSAYETIIRTRPGFIPPNITRHMGMMDIQITDADKNGQPEIKFMEREHRKGRGSVKKPSTAQVFTINT